MNFIKRAVLYCLRQRFKTFLLFAILTVIAVLLLTCIAIRDASAKTAADTRAAIGGKILLELDTEGHMGTGQQNQWGTVYSYNGDLITPEIADAIKKVDGVADYNAEGTADYYGAGVDFKYLPAELGLSYTPYGESSSYTATLSSEKCSKFQSGQYRLTDGRHITPNDTHACLLSKELADYNRLSVHDKIKMYSLDSDSITEFEIVGIFDGTEGTSGNALTVDKIPANCGFIDYATMFELFGEDYQQLTIYVEDPVHIRDVYDKIAALPELKDKTLKLNIDTGEYDMVASPLESLQKLMNTAILVILIASAAVLTLLLTVWVRNRKKEIGILLSVGKSNADIISQLFTEALIAAVIAFAVSIPVSKLIMAETGEFLADKITSQNFRLTVQFDAAYLLPLCLAEIVLIAVSVMASSWSVVRFKPKDILTRPK